MVDSKFETSDEVNTSSPNVAGRARPVRVASTAGKQTLRTPIEAFDKCFIRRSSCQERPSCASKPSAKKTDSSEVGLGENDHDDGEGLSSTGGAASGVNSFLSPTNDNNYNPVVVIVVSPKMDDELKPLKINSPTTKPMATTQDAALPGPLRPEAKGFFRFIVLNTQNSMAVPDFLFVLSYFWKLKANHIDVYCL